MDEAELVRDHIESAVSSLRIPSASSGQALSVCSARKEGGNSFDLRGDTPRAPRQGCCAPASCFSEQNHHGRVLAAGFNPPESRGRARPERRAPRSPAFSARLVRRSPPAAGVRPPAWPRAGVISPCRRPAFSPSCLRRGWGGRGPQLDDLPPFDRAGDTRARPLSNHL